MLHSSCIQCAVQGAARILVSAGAAAGRIPSRPLAAGARPVPLPLPYIWFAYAALEAGVTLCTQLPRGAAPGPEG